MKIDQRFVLSLFWSIVATAMMFYILVHYGKEKEILTLIIGMIGGTILGGIFGLYFGGSHSKAAPPGASIEATATVTASTEPTTPES